MEIAPQSERWLSPEKKRFKKCLFLGNKARNRVFREKNPVDLDKRKLIIKNDKKLFSERDIVTQFQ